MDIHKHDVHTTSVQLQHTSLACIWRASFLSLLASPSPHRPAASALVVAWKTTAEHALTRFTSRSLSQQANPPSAGTPAPPPPADDRACCCACCASTLSLNSLNALPPGSACVFTSILAIRGRRCAARRWVFARAGVGGAMSEPFACHFRCKAVQKAL
jgi:hypothetical protein